MITTLFRVFTKQIDLHSAQDDKVLRDAFESVNYGTGDQAARAAIAATRGDFDRRARAVNVLAETTTRQLKEQTDPATGRVNTEVTWADRWARANTDDPDAQVLRACSLVVRAWEVRGAGWASTVSRNQWQEFARLLEFAWQINDWAIRLDASDPTPFAQRLQIMVGTDKGRDLFEDTWAELVARDPHHHQGHLIKLTYLCRKWHGSHEEMFGFARAAAATAPEGSPLHNLPVHAATEWAMWEETREEDVRDADRVSALWRLDPELQADLDNALNRWYRNPAKRHAGWIDDCSHLAYALSRCGRYAEAAPLFDEVGKFVSSPWGWWGNLRLDEAFFRARKLARQAAS